MEIANQDILHREEMVREVLMNMLELSVGEAEGEVDVEAL